MVSCPACSACPADVLVTTTVGSGEFLKAVLQKHKFGIGVCRTTTHKKEVMRKLKAFVKLMKLVSLSEELLEKTSS